MCTQLELVEIDAKNFFEVLHKYLYKKGARNLNDKVSSKTGVSQEYLLADKRLHYLELLKLDGPVEIEFVSVEDEDLFFAMPFGWTSPLITWRPDGLGWMSVPPRPTNKNDMVLLSNKWWVELRRSFDTTVQSIVQYQLFQSGFLRLLIIPIPMEDDVRALILTNLPVVLSHLDADTALTKSGANLLSQCMIFPSPGEFPPTLNDINHGDDEQHSVNLPDQYFYMHEKNPCSVSRIVDNVPKGLLCKDSLLAPQATYGEFPALPSPDNGVMAEAGKRLAKQPLPVLVRQTCAPKSRQFSHLFPHQKRTVGWMVEIENGISPPLFCPMASMFGCYHAFSYGMDRALRHDTVEVLRPKDGHIVHGGMVAHPVGSGKTVIAVELVRRTCGLGGTIVCVPDHIVLQWCQEFHRFAPNVSTQVFTRGCQIAPSTNCLIIGHGDATVVLPYLEPRHRLIIDEPQEITKRDKTFNCLLDFSCKHCWLLTAIPQPLGLMMQLTLQYKQSSKLPLRAMEAWFVQTRCRQDPPILCLPIPSMHINMKPVTLLWQETSVMHSYAMQDDLQTAIRLASFFHMKKAKLCNAIPGLERVKKFSSLAEWVRERGDELETQLLEHRANVERIEKIMSKAAKEGVPLHGLVAAGVEKGSEDDVEVDPVAMEQLYEEHPGVPEELLLERERSMKLANKVKQLLTFMDSVVETVTANSECLICMNKLGGRVVSMLPCLHSCCASCIATIFHNNKSDKIDCPLCRCRILRHTICTFLCADKQVTTENGSKNLLDTDIQSEFGSKIFAIVSEVLVILRKTIDDKIVVFAQWTDLLEQISAAIPTEVEHCLLCGSMESRCRMIEEFRSRVSLRVMLLSSESQASG